MNRLLLILAFSLPCFAQITQSIVLSAAQQAGNTSVPSQSGDVRIEFLLQDWDTTVDNSNLMGSNFSGLVVTYLAGTPGSIQFYWSQGNSGTGSSCIGNPGVISLAGFSTKALYLRGQKTVAGGSGIPANSSVFEVWDSAGNYLTVGGPGNLCTYGTTSGSYSNGTAAGDSGSGHGSTFGFMRAYSTLVAQHYQMPVTKPASTTGLIFQWKFDNSLADDTGNYDAVLNTGSASYTSTGTIQNLVFSSPRTAATPFSGSQPTPYWSNWISLKVGATNTLDWTQSGSQNAATSAVTYSASQNTSASGCTGGGTAALSGSTVGQPTLTPPSDGPYCYDLTVTDSNGAMATSTLKLGAVTQNNGIVANPDPNVQKLFGPQIAFGQNPWGQEDKQNLYMVGAQTTYWNANYDYTWITNGTGSVSYTFAGKGPSPGASCTTLNGAILSTDLTITVTNASCLTLSGLPGEETWILLGNGLGSVQGTPQQELVRICSRSGNVLTVCYDGRGVSGNSVRDTTTLGATGWADLTTVGEFRIQGTSTLFSTDTVRPVCPGGVPGPPGPAVYSTGTVTMANVGGVAVVTASSGTPFTAGNGVAIGGYVRVAATHASGSSYPFWGQIVSFTSTALTLNRPVPAGSDASAFSYKITSPLMYMDLEFNAADGHVARALFPALGCSSNTAMFTLATHDVSAINTTVMPSTGTVGYSYKTSLTLYSGQCLGSIDCYAPGLGGRNFYYRSGYLPALTYANSVAEYATRDPEIADGIAGGGQPLMTGPLAIDGMIDLILNGSTVLTWPNLEQFAVNGELGSASCNANDLRTDAYETSALTLAAKWDTNSTNAAAFTTALLAVYNKDNGCKRNAADGYTGSEVNSFANAYGWAPQGPMTLTNGSTAVTGSGFSAGFCAGRDIFTITVVNGSSVATVASGTISSGGIRMYINDTTTPYVGVLEYSGTGTTGASIQLAGVWTGASGTSDGVNETNSRLGYMSSIWTDNNDNSTSNHHLKKPWACKFNNSGSLTLNAPWDSTTGSSYYLSAYVTGVFGVQPFMFGEKVDQGQWATFSTNSTVAAGYRTITRLQGDWFYSYGYDYTNFKGTNYTSVFGACDPPTMVAATQTFYTIHGWDAASGSPGCGYGGYLGIPTARVNNGEAGPAMIQYYLADPTPARKTIADAFYGATFSYAADCAASVLSTCDGSGPTQLSNTDMSGSKWPGFFFGIGGFFSNTWPAVRNMSLSQLCSFYGGAACNAFPGKSVGGPRKTGGNRASSGTQ